MFGYFKLDAECPKTLATTYKKYYCFLCKALAKHYGLFARFTLSYDVTLLSLFALDNNFLNDVVKINCLGADKHLKKLLSKEISKKIATINIFLTAVKLEDNVLDENSFKAKFLHFLLSKPIKKAKKNYPKTWELLNAKYEKLRLLEKNNAPLLSLENCFAQMITLIMVKHFTVTNDKDLQLLSAMAKWLYFIDALDDLDEDLKKKCFNPFSKYQSFLQLKRKKYQYLTKHFKDIFKNVNPDKQEKAQTRLIINRIAFCGVLEKTVSVMLKNGSKPL